MMSLEKKQHIVKVLIDAVAACKHSVSINFGKDRDYFLDALNFITDDLHMSVSYLYVALFKQIDIDLDTSNRQKVINAGVKYLYIKKKEAEKTEIKLYYKQTTMTPFSEIKTYIYERIYKDYDTFIVEKATIDNRDDCEVVAVVEE